MHKALAWIEGDVVVSYIFPVLSGYLRYIYFKRLGWAEGIVLVKAYIKVKASGGSNITAALFTCYIHVRFAFNTTKI